MRGIRIARPQKHQPLIPNRTQLQTEFSVILHLQSIEIAMIRKLDDDVLELCLIRLSDKPSLITKILNVF